MKNLYGWSMSQYLPTGDFCDIKVARSSLKQFQELQIMMNMVS